MKQLSVANVFSNLIASALAGRAAVTVASAILCLATAVGVQPAVAQSSFINLGQEPRVSKLRLTMDKSLTVKLSKSVSEALVANPTIADVVPLTDRSIYLIGKKIGLTRLTLLDEGKELVGVLELEVSYDVDALKAELNRNIPGADFTFRTAHGRILLGGVAPDSEALSRATDIANQFAAGGFLNAMTVAAPQQVMLEVRFIEASRAGARDLGITNFWQSSRFRGITGGDFQDNLSTGDAVVRGLLSGGVPFGTFLTRILNGGTKADLVVRALEERGLARRLAEPNLVTLSGTSANFLAGGEYPYPVDAGDGKLAVAFKKFGIELTFTPTVLAKRKISLDIEPSVSDLDFSNTVEGQPALTTRRAKTTVELRDGQSFAIAGLLQRRHSKNLSQLPWIGRVPVLGTLLRSSAYQKDETDLVIIVTPRLVRPVQPGQKLATPLDLSRPTNDKRYFVKGQMEMDNHQQTAYGHVLDVTGGWEAKTRGTGHASYK